MPSPPPDHPPSSPDELLDPQSTRFSPEEEASLLAEADALKKSANAEFAAGRYDAALEGYTAALGTCPAYVYSVRAVLWCNAAACEVKLGKWREGVEAATKAVECCDLGSDDQKEDKEDDIKEGGKKKDEEDTKEDVEEIPRPDLAPSSPQQKKEEAKMPRDIPILRPIRIKALLRRAAAHEALDTWQDLEAARADYTTLVTLSEPSQDTFINGGVRPADRALALRKLTQLTPRITAAREREVGEMWGKLKDLGNGLLRPFGLSTDNFSMKQDEATGGYSMNFKGN